MASKIPGLTQKSGYDNEAISLCVSALRRQPGWLLYQIHQRGLWDDLMIAALEPTFVRIADKKEIYNAAQRAIYAFLRNAGYRKVRRMDGGKAKVLWAPIMEIKT